MSERLVLAADVGGTKTNLAIVAAAGRGVIGTVKAEATYRSAEFASLEAMIDAFRSGAAKGDAVASARSPAIAAASVGFAGAVADGRGHGTNLPWSVDAAALARHLGLPSVGLMNDLVATGFGVAALDEASLAPLLPGKPAANGNAAVVAAGTGLGETILAAVGEGGHRIPIASEGGHADFAPRTDVELDIWTALRTRHGRVSVERVLSGPGLANVAEVLHARAGAAGAWSAHVKEARSVDEIPAVVSRYAREGACPSCVESLDAFAGIYGSEAGNLALRALALGGIYLGGGIAPRILDVLRGPTFANAFRDKEPHRALLSAIPVWVILDEKTALWGAARHASLALG